MEALVRRNIGAGFCPSRQPNCVVTEVVLFLIVALKTLDISQGSVATHLRFGEIFSDSIITRFVLILRVK